MVNSEPAGNRSSADWPSRAPSSKISVLCVLAGLDPRAGGPPVSGPNIWVSLSRAGFALNTASPVHDATRGVEADVISRLRSEGIPFKAFSYLPGSSKFVRWGVSVPLAFWLLRSARRHDIVQAHAVWLFSTVAAGVAAKLAGKPMLLVPHESLTDYDIGKGSSALRRFAKRMMKHIILALTDYIVYASPFEQRTTSVGANGPRTAAIYHPIFDDRTAESRMRRWPATLDRLQLGFLGRFDPKKNLELLIEALPHMPYAVLKVAGDGTPAYRQKLFELAERLGVADRIEWLGFIGPHQKAAYFDSIDILLMPSANEGFGMVAAEALLSGVPVAVSPATGIADLVARRACGMIIAPDSTAIASAMAQLYARPSRLGDFSRAAAAAVREDLSFSAYGRQATEIYAAFLAARPLTRPAG